MLEKIFSATKVAKRFPRGTFLQSSYSKFKKLTAILLVFLFLATPFVKVFAQTADIGALDSTTPPTESSVSTPETAQGSAVNNVPNDQPNQSADNSDANTSVLPTEENSNSNSNPQSLAEPENSTSPSAEAADLSKQAQVQTNGVSPGNPGTIPGQLDSQQSSRQSIPEPDPSTGALVYKYPLTVPPGRNGMQPSLALEYNSQAEIQDGPQYGYYR